MKAFQPSSAPSDIRSVCSTTAGAALYAKVAPSLASLKESRGALPEREKLPSGELRITAPVDIGVIVLPGIIAGFSTRYPAVTVDAWVTNRRVDLVAEGFDAALRVSMGRLSDSTLVAKKLSGLEMQLFAAPTHLARAGTPRTLEDTAGHAWVGFRRTPSSIAPALKANAPKAKARVLGDDILFVHQVVCAGVGLGVLPGFVAREDVTAGRLVRVLPRISIGSGALYLVHPPAQRVPRKVTVFRDYLVEHFAAHPLAGRLG